MLKFLKRLFSGKGFVQKHAEQIISVLNFLKFIVNSPGAKVAVALTKNPIDNIVLERLSKALPVAIIGIQASTKLRSCYEKESISDKLECVVDTLREIDKNEQNRFYFNTAKFTLKNILYDAKIKVNEEDLEDIINGTYQLSKLK